MMENYRLHVTERSSPQYHHRKLPLSSYDSKYRDGTSQVQVHENQY